jgi:hypothetical protein
MKSNLFEEIIIHAFYHELKKGGITLHVIDKNSHLSTCFPKIKISNFFFDPDSGPGVVNDLILSNLGSDFLRNLGNTCLEAADKLENYSKKKKEDADNRYQSFRND